MSPHTTNNPLHLLSSLPTLLLTILLLSSTTLAGPPTPFHQRYAETLPAARLSARSEYSSDPSDSAAVASRTIPVPTRVLEKRGIEDDLIAAESVKSARVYVGGGSARVKRGEGEAGETDWTVVARGAGGEGSTYLTDVEA